MARVRRHHYIFAALVASVLIFSGSVYLWDFEAHAVSRTWDGGGVTNDWSEDANWSADTEPGAADLAVFDGTSTKAVTIDTSISVGGIDINTGYTNTITQAAGVTVTVGTQDFDISAGTFVGGDSTIDLNDAFTISGGAFTSTTGNLQIAGNFTITSGSFDPSTGTAIADGTTSTWNILTTETFNHLTIDRPNALNLGANDTLVVLGTLTLTNGTFSPLSATIDARGDIIGGAGFDGGNGYISFGDDTVVQTFSIAGGSMPGIRLDDPDDANDEIDLNAAATIRELETTAGFSGIIPFNNPSDFTPTFSDWTQAAGSYDASAQTAWNIEAFDTSGGGTFIAPALVTANGVSGTWNVDVTQTFADFTINRTSQLTMTANDTFVITGDLILTNGSVSVASATLDVRGDVTQAAGFDGGSAYISFGDDAVVQTYTMNGGTAPGIRFDDPDDANDNVDITATQTITGVEITSGFSGTVPLNNPSDFTLTISDWTQEAGTYDASAQTAWNIVAFDNSVGGTFVAPALVTATGVSGTWNVNISQDFNDFTINRTGALTMTANDIIVVNGDLILTNGSVNLSTGVLLAMQDITQASTFDGGTAFVSFGNDALAQTYTVNGGESPGIRFDDPDDANDSYDIVTNPTSIEEVNIKFGFSGAIPFNNPSDFSLTMGSWTQDGGTYDASAQSSWTLTSSFSILSGTFVAPELVTFSGTSGGFTANSPQTFENVTFNRLGGTTFQPSATMTITGLLTLTNGSINIVSGTVNAQGDVTVASTWDGGTAVHTFTGGAVQTFDLTGATGLINSDISIDKSGGQVNLASALLMDAASQDLTIVEGKLDIAGQNLTVNGTSGAFTVQDGGVFELFGSETITLNASNPTLASGSTVSYTGDGDALADTYIVTTLEDTYHHLTVASTDGNTDTFQLGAPLDVNGNFTNSGTFDVTASDHAMTVAGDWTNTGDFQANNGLVTLDGGNQTVDETTFHDFTKISPGDTLTFAAGETQTFTGTLTLAGADGDRMLIRSTTPGSHAFIDAQGTTSAMYLDVQDNNNINATDITCSPGCFDSGNNEGWIFPGVSVSAISGNTTEAGGTATFTIVLNTQPTGDVEIDSVTEDSTEGVVTNNSTVTFTTLNWDTPQTVTVTGQDDDVDDGDIVYTIDVAVDAANTADAEYDTFDPADVSVTNTDNDTAGVTVSTISNDTTEAGGTATFTVVLDSEPTGNVEVDSASNDATEGVVTIGATLTFTTLNWDTPQTVTVTGQDDDIADGNILYSIVTSTDDANTADALYDAVDPNDVAVSNNDNDTAGVTVSAISGDTTEAGGTATFTVVLDSEPTGNVEIDSVSNDSTEGVVTGNSTLTFTALDWDTPQTVTVTGQDDVLTDGDILYSIIVDTDDANTADATYDPIDPDDVAVTNMDNDSAAGVTVSAISGDTTEAGGTATFTVVLDTLPTGNVEIDSVSSDLTEGVVTGGATLTFTTLDWFTPQTVTVTGQDDDVDDGDIAYTIVVDTDDANTADAAYDSVDPNDVAVTNTDDDTAGVTVSAISGNTTEAGGTATFTVVLDSEPTGNVEIDSVSADSTEGIVTGGATLTFTTLNWDTPQTVTATGQDDDVDDGDIGYTIVVTVDAGNTADALYDAVNPADVSATNTDDDTADVTIVESGGSTNVAEAGETSDSYTIVLTSEPTADVTIDITDDADATTNVASRTFTSLNWFTPQGVTVTAVDDAFDETNPHTATITHTATSTDGVYDGILIADVVANVTDDDDSTITVSAISGDTTEAGGTAAFTVVLDSQPSDDVVIDLDSNDTTEGTVNFTQLTFTNGDWNIAQTVTVTGVNDDIDDGNISFDIVLDPAVSTDLDFNGVDPSDVDVVNIDNDTADVIVTESGGSTDVSETGPTSDTYTIVLGSEPTATVTIDISVGVQVTVDDASLNFTIGNWDTPQTVTVTAVDDGADEADTHNGTISHVATSTDGVYDGFVVDDVVVNITDNDTSGGGGGGGSGDDRPQQRPTPPPSNYSIVIEDGAKTTPDPEVSIVLRADNADEYEVNNSSSFSGENWMPFTEPAQRIMWTLGAKSGNSTVFVRFRNDDGGGSSTVSDSIIIVPGEEVPEEEEPTDPPDEPMAPKFEDKILKFVRSIDNGGSVYAVLDDNTLHPFEDLPTYLTYANGCNEFDWVADSIIENATIGEPIWLNSGTTLVKFFNKPEVYVIEDDPTDPWKRILRKLASEEIAALNFGDRWNAYVLEVPENDAMYSFGSPVTGLDYPEGLASLRSRVALHAEVSYELSLEMPNGDRIDGFGGFARRFQYPNGSQLFSFEDDLDWDYNDVILKLDPTNCTSYKISAFPLDSKAHHKIWLTIYWDRKAVGEVLVFEDSHDAVNSAATVDVSNHIRFYNVTAQDFAPAATMHQTTAKQ